MKKRTINIMEDNYNNLSKKQKEFLKEFEKDLMEETDKIIKKWDINTESPKSNIRIFFENVISLFKL